jgi:ligand-binding sensor domain-containing protein
LRRVLPIFLAILLSACILPSKAQDLQIKFKRLSEQDRLSRSWVKCIFQDRTGYLWIGTAEGLYKYDGVRFKIYKYNAADSTSLNHNNTNIIFEDSQGGLWIGTQAGLNLYNREKDRFKRVTSINNYISCIYEFNRGNFLVGTAGGLFLLNPQDFSVRQLYYDFYAAKFLKDKNNNFWMATHKGLMLLDTSDYSYVTYNANDDLKLGNHQIIMWSIFEDSRGGIWIGTATDGLIYMQYKKDDPLNPSFRRFVHNPRIAGSINQGTIYSISEDENATSMDRD